MSEGLLIPWNYEKFRTIPPNSVDGVQIVRKPLLGGLELHEARQQPGSLEGIGRFEQALLLDDAAVQAECERVRQLDGIESAHLLAKLPNTPGCGELRQLDNPLLYFFARAFELRADARVEFVEAGVVQELDVRHDVATRGHFLLDDAEAPLAVQQQVEATVGQLLALADVADAADVEDGSGAQRGGLAARLEQGHADHALGPEGVLGHRAVARLEDVEWEHGVREEHDVRKREGREARRKLARGHGVRLYCRSPPEPEALTQAEREEARRVLTRLRHDGRALALAYQLPLRSIDAERANVRRRYGICYSDGCIRIRLRNLRTGELLKYSSMIDTLCHELAHLRHFDHSPRFYAFYEKVLGYARRNGIYRPGTRHTRTGGPRGRLPVTQGWLFEGGELWPRRRPEPSARALAISRQLELFPDAPGGRD